MGKEGLGGVNERLMGRGWKGAWVQVQPCCQAAGVRRLENESGGIESRGSGPSGPWETRQCL